MYKYVAVFGGLIWIVHQQAFSVSIMKYKTGISLCSLLFFLISFIWVTACERWDVDESKLHASIQNYYQCQSDQNTRCLDSYHDKAYNRQAYDIIAEKGTPRLIRCQYNVQERYSGPGKIVEVFCLVQRRGFFYFEIIDVKYYRTISESENGMRIVCVPRGSVLVDTPRGQWLCGRFKICNVSVD